MPNWSTTPPREPHEYALRIVRAPTKGRLIGLITTNTLIGCDTHYVNHRTLPCDGPRCAACLKGFPHRWHGYIAAAMEKTHEQVIIEVTVQAAQQIADYQHVNGGLRGSIINLWRAAPRDNARVIVRLAPADLQRITIPPAPDLLACLSKIWGIPESEMHNNTPNEIVQELKIMAEKGNGKLSQPIKT